MSFSQPAPTARRPWLWVPSLYFAEAVPYVLVNFVSVTLYQRLGISNEAIAFYTSLLYLPWVVKPLWSPVVDVLGTKRRWTLMMQFAIACAILGVSATIQTVSFFAITLAFFWLMAFSSATHDIAADGYYMLGLSDHDQAWFVGIRNTFYRFGSIAGLGLLVTFAGILENRTSTPAAWTYAFFLAAAVFFLLAGYHQWAVPAVERNATAATRGSISTLMLETVTSYFRKPGIIVAISYILLYRFAEGQLVKLAQLFLLDERSDGGLAIDTKNVGIIYGTIGATMLIVGGILGGMAAARHGLKRWLLWMAVAINLPNLVYVYLAYHQPENLWIVTLCVGVEQFGYGFGFAGYMLYMLYIARGEHQTAHYAICTGFMALGMMIAGLFSGKLQVWLGYDQFFVWVVISTIPSFVVTLLVPLDDDFGRKKSVAPTS